MAESQLKHRQSLESAVVTSNLRAQAIGQVFAFALGSMAILGGIWLIAHDKSPEGLTSIITSVVGLTAVYFYGRYEQAQERSRKRAEMREASEQGRLPLED